MFSQEEPFGVNLKTAYFIRRQEIEHAVANNMHKAIPHCFRFKLKGKEAEMTVDNIPESHTTFSLTQETHGSFSLASNGTMAEPGAFRYVRLTANGKTLLNIDFKNIQSVEELESYFTCYYFHTLSQKVKGFAAPIRNFWSINARGHLVCSIPNKGRVAFGSSGPYAVLTLRHTPISDFEAEIGFEQCWRKYGIMFGCEHREFPFYLQPNRIKAVNIRGGFAYVRAHNGACCLRSDLLDPDTLSIVPYMEKACPQVEPLFRSADETTLPVHTLTYHLEGNMTYDFGTHAIHTVKDSVLYLPPNTPCRLSGETDRIYRVEFQCDQTFEPQLIVMKQPDLVKRLFIELHTLWTSNLQNKSFSALSIFYRILAELSQPVSGVYTDMIQKCLTFIHNHFSEPALTVKEIAVALNVSESHLYHSFHEACNISPKEYILNSRLQYACTLLKTGQYKVYEVAEKCGFSDVKHFITIFKHKIGISPKQYALSKNEPSANLAP